MFTDFVMHSLVSYFELGYVGSAHGAVWYFGLVFVCGCESLDTSYTERVFAVCDQDIGCWQSIKAERTVASGRIIRDSEVLYQCNFLEIRRGVFYVCGAYGIYSHVIWIIQYQIEFSVVKYCSLILCNLFANSGSSPNVIVCWESSGIRVFAHTNLKSRFGSG